MAIQSKTFSYPYYASFLQDYKTYKFDLTETHESTKEKISIFLRVELGDEEIKKQIDLGNIGLFCLAECKNTIFRKLYALDSKTYSLKIDLDNKELDERLHLTAYIVALKNFSFTNLNFSDFFKGTDFYVEKGNKLGESTYDIDLFFHHYISSAGENLFTRSFKEDMSENDPPYIQYMENSLDIVMPKKMYLFLNALENNSNSFPMIHSTYLIPALTQIISQLLSKDSDGENAFLDNNSDKKWLTLIQERLSTFGTIDDLEPEDSWKYAQLILKTPVNMFMREIQKRRELQNQINQDEGEWL